VEERRLAFRFSFYLISDPWSARPSVGVQREILRAFRGWRKRRRKRTSRRSSSTSFLPSDRRFLAPRMRRSRACRQREERGKRRGEAISSLSIISSRGSLYKYSQGDCSIWPDKEKKKRRGENSRRLGNVLVGNLQDKTIAPEGKKRSNSSFLIRLGWGKGEGEKRRCILSCAARATSLGRGRKRGKREGGREASRSFATACEPHHQKSGKGGERHQKEKREEKDPYIINRRLARAIAS